MKTLLLASIFTSLARLSSSGNSPSNRDNNSYGSYTNPNVAYSHYWADANNVLQDLSSFKKLYVRYHGCAWSTTSYSIGGGQSQDDDSGTGVSGGCAQAAQNQNDAYYYDQNGNQDDQQNGQNNNQNDQNNNQDNNQNDQNNNQDNNQNNNQDNNQNQNDGNNNERDRKKNRFLEDGGDGQSCGNKANSCDKWWGGMQSCMGANVAYSLYGILPGDGATSKFNPCNKATFINSFFTKDGLANFVTASNGAVDISGLNQQCANYGNGLGSAVSCSAKGKFVVDTFNGGCYGQNYVATVDTLDDLNEELESEMDCVLIYSSDGSTNYATDLLSDSSQCSFDMESCPDPYGLVEKFEFNLAMAQRYTKYKVPDVTTGAFLNVVISLGFTAAGAALLISRFRSKSDEDDGVPQLLVNNYVVAA
eukprot:CAMPEP_0172421330 /NCGR_PEP_ID=MMETSP1064-20121228/7579_1 /TAXON_ID=202472 /ORGANISM="Aulacoseira subarctica , Strain CCAP 1002/5" /LENGTH=418 /DNA_ID=CAMNT_0013161669 /DNA_START=68 /DNA_END=1324 /DNA_ORIENTATION=-